MDASKEILSLFQQVAAIPRASKHEDQIARWLLNWAAERRLAA